MRGLFKRKGSDIWQGRFRIPENLWRERKRLVALGVKDAPKTQEHARSTGKLDLGEACEAFQAMRGAWDAKMAARGVGCWRRGLRGSPRSSKRHSLRTMPGRSLRIMRTIRQTLLSLAPCQNPLRSMTVRGRQR